MTPFFVPYTVFIKQFRYTLPWNPIRIPSSFIIQQLAKTRRST